MGNESEKIECMKHAGRINRQAIEYGFKIVEPGMTLLELDSELEKFILNAGAEPAFKGYLNYPNTACLSVNDVVIHGLPNEYKIQDGDYLTIDIGTKYGGWNVDAASTDIIGDGDSLLLESTLDILLAELEVIKDGVSIYDIIVAAEKRAAKHRVNVFADFCGHKIGRSVHEEPVIPNSIDSSKNSLGQKLLIRKYSGITFRTGDTLCLEPVATFGGTLTSVDSDGWTIRTRDGSRCAHFEHCILVEQEGYTLLS
jgi:methionyl aminopeptidase